MAVKKGGSMRKGKNKRTVVIIDGDVSTLNMTPKLADELARRARRTTHVAQVRSK